MEDTSEPRSPAVRELELAITNLLTLCEELAPEAGIALLSPDNMPVIIKAVKLGNVSQAAQIFATTIASYSDQRNSKNEADPSWIKAAKDCLSKLYPVGMILLNLTGFAAEVLLYAKSGADLGCRV